MTEAKSPNDLLDAAATAAAAVQLLEPTFDFRVRWASGYDQLFRGTTIEETGIEDLVERAFRYGRVLLQAAGGAGKTSILLQLLKAYGSHGTLVAMVDLRLWRPDMFATWTELEDNEPARMGLLFEMLAIPRGATEATVMRLPAEIPRLLMIDGLNEVTRQVGDSLIRTIDFFARRNPRAGVIATDRLVRRPIDDSHWKLATIAPIEGEAGLRGNAFFRNLALHEGTSSTSSTIAHNEYLKRHANLTYDELINVARAALALYATTRSRAFPVAELRQHIGNLTTDKLLTAGVVIRVNGDASFSHHLIHDYLASKAVAEDENLWTPDTFDVVTLRASSFDSLAMALEQLRDPGQADLFMRMIYDWNFYGAAYALATGRGRDSAAVTDDMEVALLAMLAERRWDLIRATCQQVTDALALFPSPFARTLLEVDGFETLIATVLEAVGESSALTGWLHLFARPAGSSVTDDELLVIEDTDSLMGWTMSNAAKRAVLSTDQLATLRHLLRGSDDQVVRWRAAHALGAHASSENVAALFAALTDDYYWVRYGAVRSLIEIAARSPDQRPAVFEGLRTEIDRASDDPSIVNQVGRSIILRDPPSNWLDFAGPLVEDLWASAESQERQDRWRSVAYELTRAQEEGDVDAA